MKKITLLLLLFCSVCNAQKSAPVAGHAARLVDLLKKDYNAVDVTARNETILKDMEEVISTFKVYTALNISNIEINQSYSFTAGNSTLNERVENIIMGNLFVNYGQPNQRVFRLDNVLNSYNKSNDEYQELNKSILAGKSIDASSMLKIQNAEKHMLKNKKAFLNAKFNSDIYELVRLYEYFRFDDRNIYLSHMCYVFIEKFISVKNLDPDNFAKANYNSSIQKALPFFGGDLTFEAAIDGLSRFLAKRIKEELTIHAIEKIQRYLEHPSPDSYLNELMVLLPVTTSYLKAFDASRSLNFIEDVKQYIEKDLNNLLTNVANLKTTPRFKKYIENNPDLDFAFEALELIPQLSKIENPIDYFDMIESSRNIQRWTDVVPINDLDNKNIIKVNIANSIKFASLMAHSLMVVEDNKPKFASTAFIANYGNEHEFFFLYLGFLAQQNSKYYNIEFYVNGRAESINFLSFPILSSPGSTFNNFKSYLSQIATNAEKVHNSITNIKKVNKAGEDVTAEDIFAFSEDLINFSENVLTVTDSLIKDRDMRLFSANIPATADIDRIVKKSTPYFKTAHSVNAIFLDLHKKNYTTAILNAIEIPATLNSEASNYKLYSQLVNITQPLEKAESIYSFSEFFKYSKLPNSEENYKKLQNLAKWVDASMIGITSVGFAPLKTKFGVLNTILLTPYSSVNAVNREGYREAYQDLKNVIESGTNWESFYNEYAAINISGIIQNLDDALATRGVNVMIRSNLKDNFELYLKESLIANLTNSSADKEKAAQTGKDLLDHLRIYLPELFPNLFTFKDDNTVKIIHFVNDMAKAGNAEEVEAALDNFALPAGSSSIKEESSGYVSINSFPGLQFGYGKAEVNGTTSSRLLGFTAPVGLYLQGFRIRKMITMGLFIPVIDIAAPVKLRLGDNDKIQTLPDLEFKDIFSPGLFLSIGFNGSPFGANLGVQYGPSLQAIETNETTSTAVKEKSAFYLSASFFVDVPLFTLFSKSRN